MKVLVLENAPSFAYREEWIENHISWKLEDYIGVSGVTIECNNLWSVSEIAELILGQPK